MLTCSGCSVERFCIADHQKMASKKAALGGSLRRHKDICGVLSKWREVWTETCPSVLSVKCVQSGGNISSVLRWSSGDLQMFGAFHICNQRACVLAIKRIETRNAETCFLSQS